MSASESGRYPAGTGWLVGYLFALVVAATTWVLVREVAIAIVLFAATGPAMGYAIEEALDTRPASPRQRRLLQHAIVAGIVVGLVVLAYVLFG